MMVTATGKIIYQQSIDAAIEDAILLNLTDSAVFTISEADDGGAVFLTTGITSSANSSGCLQITVIILYETVYSGLPINPVEPVISMI